MTRPIETAEIIAVGSELLTPYRIDTNSLFLTGQLNELGITVRTKAVVGDDGADLSAVVRAALARADLVVLTGGLGPTDDDLTRQTIAEVLGLALHEDAAILDGIRARFTRRGAVMPEINRRQAMLPQGATALPNPLGTAPGLRLEADGHLIILLPGPPRELQPMFRDHVAPELGRRGQGRRVYRRVIKITGRSESQVEEIAQPIYSKLSTGHVPVQTTILASPGQIELHLAAGGADAGAIREVLDRGVAELHAALGSVVFSIDGRSLEAVVGDLLRERAWHVGVAESCTGGLVLGRLTDVPGSSAWLTGGVVAYANEMKVREVGVSADLIAAHGAVSEPVAEAMAEGIRTRLGVEVAIAVTGIAGPTGGSVEKPVGTVVIAVAGPHPAVRTFLFPGDRQTVRQHSTAAALDLLRRSLASVGVRS